ncbi:MAG: Holliday junction resolvase RuvX, partial [Clostridia bacterium]|nr:Holliday junction resolvase RuvX [Clostridia bacterium]
MIILAVDPGKARTGIAVSDESGSFAFPHTVLTEYHADRLVERVAALAQELHAGRIVVGYPKNMDGSAGERAQQCAALSEAIEEACGLPTVLWDERLTTVSAHTALNMTDTRGKKRKQVVDAVAAT